MSPCPTDVTIVPGECATRVTEVASAPSSVPSEYAVTALGEEGAVSLNPLVVPYSGPIAVLMVAQYESGNNLLFAVVVGDDGTVVSSEQIPGAVVTSICKELVWAGDALLFGAHSNIYKSMDNGYTWAAVSGVAALGSYEFIGIGTKSELEWLVTNRWAQLSHTVDGGATFSAVTASNNAVPRMKYVPSLDAFIILRSHSYYYTLGSAPTTKLSPAGSWGAYDGSIAQIADDGAGVLMVARYQNPNAVRRLVYTDASDLASLDNWIDTGIYGYLAIAYGDGKFVAVGKSGAVAASMLSHTDDNGASWTTIDLADQRPAEWQGANFTVFAVDYMPSVGKWVVAGRIRQTSFPFGYEDYYAISEDLVTWDFTILGLPWASSSNRTYAIASL